jgi:microcystin-dependent protein
MADYFLGQIMLSGFNFAPKNFAQCNGQLLPIVQNQALFSLLGTLYGGNGSTTFQLPNLMGRTPVGAGNTYPIGMAFGVESVTLNNTTMPLHTHPIAATTTAGKGRNPTNSIYGAASEQIYGNASSGATPLYSQQMQNAGNSQPHQNMQPYNVLNFSMCIAGIYPSRS